MNEDDLRLIKDLIEDTIAEYHCPPCQEEEWLTTKEFCERYKISEPTLRAMRRQGQLEYKKFGQSYRYLAI